jgi:hypothetical protein
MVAMAVQEVMESFKEERRVPRRVAVLVGRGILQEDGEEPKMDREMEKRAAMAVAQLRVGVLAVQEE